MTSRLAFQALAGATASIAFAVSLTACTSNDQATSGTKPPAANTDLLEPEKQPSEMTPDEFALLPMESKLNYVGPILNTDTEATAARLNAALDGLGYAGYNYFNRPVVQPAITNSTQEITDQMTLASFQAWELSNQGTLKMDEAMKIADVTNRGREYNDLVELLGKPTPVISLHLAWENTREQLPNSGEYAEFQRVISYTEQIILSKDPYNPEYVKVTAGFMQGSVDNSGVWVLVRTNDTEAPPTP